MNIRRKLIGALGAGALVAPLGSFAQQSGKVWRIGILSAISRAFAHSADRYGAFIAGLRELGYVEGHNITVEWRYANSHYEGLPALAAELVNLNVDVIVTSGTPGVRAAQRATTKIPIVAASFADPAGTGLVASLAHPGGNLTGLSTMAEDIYPKRLEMLGLVVPKTARIAVLTNANNQFHQKLMLQMDLAAKKLGQRIQAFKASKDGELVEAFAQMSREKVGDVLITDDSYFSAERLGQLAELAAKYKLPSLHSDRQYVDVGGLMSYGRNSAEFYRRAANYVDKILKGAKPGDLPIEQPSTLELLFNMKTAKALGIKIPDSILLRADKVIE